MKTWLLIVCISFSSSSFGQINFSVATDASVIRNFSPKQKFTAFGQALRTVFHFTPKENLYLWLNYFTPGRYKNEFLATASQPLAIPQVYRFMASGELSIRHLSIGWQHYFMGAHNAETGVNIYGLAGFGFLFAKVSNSFSLPLDTAMYTSSIIEGNGKFKRLTFDAGVGAELPVGGNIFLYSDLRTFLPASNQTSGYLHSQRNVPVALIFSAGLRIFFDFTVY